MTEGKHSVVGELVILGMLADQRGNLENEIESQVAVVRTTGASWRMIGTALGTSGQGAWERYSGNAIPLGSRRAGHQSDLLEMLLQDQRDDGLDLESHEHPTEDAGKD